MADAEHLSVCSSRCLVYLATLCPGVLGCANVHVSNNALDVVENNLSSHIFFVCSSFILFDYS